MATVKEIIDEFCDRINQPRESVYVAGTTPNARQLLSLYKFIARELTSKSIAWPQLKRVYNFTTVTGQSLYQLPGDFDRLLAGTQWGVTNQIPLQGPISNAQLAFQTYGTTAISPFPSYQINGPQGYIFNTAPYTQRSQGYFEISPAGQNSTDINAIAYMSSNYVWPTDWVSGATYAVGNMVSGVANMYRCTAITTGIAGSTRPSVLTGTVVDGGVTWTVYHEPYPITADTDFSLLDDDLLIEGLRWAWYRAKKQDYAQERADWEQSVRTAAGRQNGSMMLNAGYNVNNMQEWPRIPDGGWTI